MCVHANIEPLAWESEFFSLPTARLTGIGDAESPLITRAELDAFALVQAKIASSDYAIADSLAACGFGFVEGEVDLVLSLHQAEASTTTVECIPATAADIPALRLIAASAFRLSRFRAPWYQPEDSSQLYALWAEKAVLGTFDHHCLLIKESDGRIKGFVTLRLLADRQIRIGLLAVSAEFSGKGIGKALVQSAISWCRAQSIAYLRVATQVANIAALRLYISAGASVASTSYWLYRESLSHNNQQVTP